MSYRARILDFIDDLNHLAKDDLMFPNRIGEFEIQIKDGLKNVDGKEIDCARIYFMYKDKDMAHPIYIKDIFHEHGFKLAYFDILKYGILGVDSVNEIKDGSTGAHINLLNFRTLITTGLGKLKNNIKHGNTRD